MRTSVRPAEGSHLFVLDDAGVLFSAARQELHTVSTAATFIWCCIEDGLTPREIVAAYSRAFSIGATKAERHVVDLLCQWQGLGYIACDEILEGSPIDLTTALGRLLTNASLRQDFRNSPASTARRLRVRQSDIKAFLSLDADALERQVSWLRAKRADRRQVAERAESSNLFMQMFGPGQTALEAAAETRMSRLRPKPIARFYWILTTRFCLRFASPSQEARVHPLIAHFEIREPTRADVVIDLLELNQGHLILEDIVPAGYCARIEQLAPLVKNRLMKHALDRHDYFLLVHAGVVSKGTRSIMLPGRSGCGKTTLTAGLSLSGFQYLTDELALLERSGFALSTIPLSLGIKAGAVEILADYWPEVRDLPVHIREDGQFVRYLAPPRSSSGSFDSALVRWIIFPRYKAGADTHLRPITKPEALRRLLQECLAVPKLLDRAGVENLVQWTRQMGCYELLTGSLAEAIRTISSLCSDEMS